MNKSQTVAIGIALLVVIWWFTTFGASNADASVNSSWTQPITPTPGEYDLAHAISVAEGFPVAGSIPARANNPIDLEVGDVGNGKLGEGITIFSTVAQGWQAAYWEMRAIRTGGSRYALNESFVDMGNTFTGPTNGPTWAANVVAALQQRGYSVDTSSAIGDVLSA